MREPAWTIRRLGHLGDGIAEGPVYAPMTLPGEVVSGVLDAGRLRDVRIMSPSDQRVRPPCRHFKSCGGCSVQHGSDALVAGWKQEIVHGALAAQRLEAGFLPMHVSPAATRRRATFSAKRTRKGALAGFHGRASDMIVDIPDCRILHPNLKSGPALAEALATAAASRKGEISVSVTVTEGGLDVHVTGGKPLDGPLRMELADVARQGRLSRLTWEGETLYLSAPPAQRFGAAEVVPPPGAFLQATKDGEATLVGDVQAHLRDAGRIVDLFAGCGTFTFPLAEEAQVHAVEGEVAMVAALEAGWRNVQGLKSVTAEARDLFREPLSARELSAYDAVLLDPPRAGAEAQARELAGSGVARIAYVSCSPVSFARDARILVDAGYTLAELRVVDQFRWSPHVELVARLDLAAG